MRNPSDLTLVGAQREFYFENYSPHGAGYLLRGGVGIPTRRNDWSDVREMWSYPYYVLEMMLEDGAGSYRNESGFECKLGYGDFFLALPDFKQYYGPGREEKWSELCVSFAGRAFDLLQESVVSRLKCPVWHLSHPAPWIERLRTELQKPRPSTELGGALETARFLTFLLEMIEHATPVTGGEATSDWFSQACLLLTRDLHHKVDVQGIAGSLGMSYHTFRLYFKRRAGISPSQYRDQQRIKIATDLLRTTNKPCKSIAFILGYSNGDHFSSHFKEHTGLSPREYRKSLPQGGGDQ